MQHQSLFPTQMPRQQGPKALVQFKAGKCSFSNNMVTADARKGEVSLRQSEDALMHFVWKDRGSGATEDDLIIFPQEAVFKRVPHCKDGYVYLLEFNTSNRKLFYWSQEPRKKGSEYSKAEDNAKEDKIVEQLNNFLNNPPAPTQAGGPGAGGFGGFGGLTHNDLMAMLTAGGGPGGPGGGQPPAPSSTSAPAPQTPANPAPTATSAQSTAAGATVTATDLQNILSNIGVPQGAGDPAAAPSAASAASAAPAADQPATTTSAAPAAAPPTQSDPKPDTKPDDDKMDTS